MIYMQWHVMVTRNLRSVERAQDALLQMITPVNDQENQGLTLGTICSDCVRWAIIYAAKIRGLSSK
jgi:hypothetical protein